MDEAERLPLRERRNRGLNDLATVVEAIYGPRCTRREPGCLACAGWSIFDMMDQWTDSSLLEEELAMRELAAAGQALEK